MAGPLNAFVPDSTAHLPGSDHGPLAGLTFAARTSSTSKATSRVAAIPLVGHPRTR